MGAFRLCACTCVPCWFSTSPLSREAKEMKQAQGELGGNHCSLPPSLVPQEMQCGWGKPGGSIGCFAIQER